MIIYYDKNIQMQGNGKNFQGKVSKKLPTELRRRALIKLHMIDAAENVSDLRIPPANFLEQLQGDRAGQYSIRINQQYRICFVWDDNNAYDVEIVDYH